MKTVKQTIKHKNLLRHKYNRIGLIVLSLMLLLPLSTMAEERIISGIVRSATTSEPLVGATVRVQNTSIGTLTNEKGEYTLSVPTDAKLLMITYLGYRREVKHIDQRTVINAKLYTNSHMTDEIVVQASRA